jgi:hypothetical protein
MIGTTTTKQIAAATRSGLLCLKLGQRQALYVVPSGHGMPGNLHDSGDQGASSGG